LYEPYILNFYINFYINYYYRSVSCEIFLVTISFKKICILIYLLLFNAIEKDLKARWRVLPCITLTSLLTEKLGDDIDSILIKY